MSKKLDIFLIFLICLFFIPFYTNAQDNIPTEEKRKNGVYANFFHFEFLPGKTDDALNILNKTLIPAYRNAGVDVTVIEDLMGTKDVFMIIPLKSGPEYYSFVVPAQDAEAWKQLVKITGSAEKAEAQMDEFIGYVKRQSQTLVFIPDKNRSLESKFDNLIP
jgi:hypothetical protein